MVLAYMLTFIGGILMGSMLPYIPYMDPSWVLAMFDIGFGQKWAYPVADIRR